MICILNKIYLIIIIDNNKNNLKNIHIYFDTRMSNIFVPILFVTNKLTNTRLAERNF